MEKTQVLIVHGGNSFSKTENFYEYLKKYEVIRSCIKKSDWKVEFSERLGFKYEVFKLMMPNKQNADYNAWKIWFEKYFEFLVSKKIILIGHSLGGLFLVKYLSENKFLKPISQIHLVAPVFDYGFGKHLGNFSFDKNKLDNITKQCDEIYLYHSTDDNIVPYNHSIEYQEVLEKSELITLKNRGHVNQKDFPELIERIKKS
jgi:predicted alpha/beta hydrolase family esterase